MEKALFNSDSKKNSLESDFFLEVWEAELLRKKIFKKQLDEEDAEDLKVEKK